MTFIKEKIQNTPKQSISLKQSTFLKIYKQKLCNISATCSQLNMSRETFYLWKRKYKKFCKQIHNLEEGLIDFAETKLIQNIKDGKETSLIFFLKTKGKARGYVEKQELDMNNLNAIEIKFDKEL